MRRAIFVGTVTLFGALVSAAAASAETGGPSPVTLLDSDDDKTIDISEMGKAASDIFDNIDSDGDGKLDIKAVGKRISREQFRKADIDKDDMLDKNEYFALSDGLLRAADVNKDGTLDDKEFSSKEGKKLQKLIQ